MAGTPRHNLPVKGRKLFLVAASAAVGLWLIVRMADWMVLSRGLLGMTREEVTSLLGGTPATGIFTEWDLVYRLGAERGFFSIDSEWLVLKFDRSGHAIDATILRD
jgi:hypothetical protein